MAKVGLDHRLIPADVLRQPFGQQFAVVQHVQALTQIEHYVHVMLNQKDGHMTANGEAFNPNALSAAHKHLPLPTNVRVTNLQNGRSVIVRVNDRGPFPSDHNPASGRRIIDLSYAAAKQLGFHDKGTARVRVETIDIDAEV